MKHTLERQENLFLVQDEIVSVEVENGCRFRGCYRHRRTTSGQGGCHCVRHIPSADV